MPSILQAISWSPSTSRMGLDFEPPLSTCDPPPSFKQNRQLGWQLQRLAYGAGVALMIYVSGAILARVLYERGYIRQGSPTFEVLESVYQPFQLLSDSSPTCVKAFDWAVGLFIPKKSASK